MSHTLTLTFPTLTELQAAVAKLTGAEPAVGNEKPTPAKPSSTKPSASAEKTAPVETKTADAAKDKPADEKPAEPFPYATLQKAVMDLVAVDPEGPKAVLKELGIPTFKGSDPALWEQGKSLLEAALKKAKADKAASEAA